MGKLDISASSNAPDELADAIETRSIFRTKLCGISLGLIITGLIMSDFLRPPFVAVNINSEASSHVIPPLVTAIHLVANIVLLIPSIILAMFEPIDFRNLGIFPLLAGALVIIAMLSIIANIDSRSMVYIAVLALTFTSSALFIGSRHGRTIGAEAFMASLAIGCGASLVIAIALGEYSWGRLASRAGPTYWGMVAIMTFSLAFALRKPMLRFGVIGLACAALVLCSARGGMLAVSLAAIVVAAVTLNRTPAKQRGRLVAILIPVLIVSPVALAWAADHLLAISDPSRGMSSGATGRTYAWAEAWSLFEEHPFLGIGYRRHEQFITAATSAHEAYLAVLAEMGVAGLFFYVVLLVGAAVRMTSRALREDDALVPLTAASFMWAYILIGLTENLALNTGLAMPLTMMFVTALGWSIPDRTRAPKAQLA
ncbi:O-antigen ligase family protein [Rhizorhabdus argentea]|uniref:O-antigen ligase family protein n=1 Tax=Rhizorhabdus argentea TaxID=1387174 RepID=UPI0030EF4119